MPRSAGKPGDPIHSLPGKQCQALGHLCSVLSWQSLFPRCPIYLSPQFR